MALNFGSSHSFSRNDLALSAYRWRVAESLMAGSSEKAVATANRALWSMGE